MASAVQFRALVLMGLGGLLGGCASFNDTVTVAIGDQFGLLDLDIGDGNKPTQRWRTGEGFECDFDARSERNSWFGRERHVTGSIRCHPLVTSDHGSGEGTSR